MKIPVRCRRAESGQAIVTLVAALIVPLLLVIAVALGASCLYVQRQLAQTAADSAAQAGIMDMLNCSPTPSACTASAQSTANSYAQTNGFNLSSDTVTVSFPTAATAGVSSGTITFIDPLIQVTVQRSVSGLIGWPTTTVTAVATAGISTANKVALVK